MVGLLAMSCLSLKAFISPLFLDDLRLLNVFYHNSKGNILKFSVFSCAKKPALIVPFSVVSYLILKLSPLSISFRICNSTIDFVHSTHLETRVVIFPILDMLYSMDSLVLDNLKPDSCRYYMTSVPFS